MGSIVTVPTRSVPEGVSKFLLIDGQQRLTTLQILLAAIRDTTRELPGSKVSDKLDASYLVNRYEDGLDHFKLLPTQTNGDRDAFLTVLKAGPLEDSTSLIAKAYRWFSKRLKSRGAPDPSRLADVVTRRLSLVSIVLDHDDNPHLIFESLNYKGEPLEQGDLIRNYFLMRVPVSDQEKLFRQCWEPMQSRLGNQQISEFVRHYLTRQGSVVKQSEIYRTLKERVDNQPPEGIATFLRDMHRSALHYHRLLDPSQESNPELQIRLQRLQQLDVGVVWPLLLNLYADYDSRALTSKDFCSILDVLENFFVRRFICSIPTHGLNKSLSPVYNQARKEVSLLQGIKATLALRGYPSDAAFINALTTVKLYGPGERLSKVRLVLESLERALAGKEPVQTDVLTIEHIMPQVLTPWWENHLGERCREIHDIRLHTLGNLTLTGYNSELSNNDFSSKRLHFRNSPVYLTKSVAIFDHWTEASIQQRSQELAELAVSVWPFFGSVNAPEHQASILFTGKVPVALMLLGNRKLVHSWRDVMQGTIEFIQEAVPDSFEEVVGQFPRLFSSDASRLRTPRQITGDTPIFFETNLSAESVGRYCQQLVAAVGYSPSDWTVETQS
jgi:hypothetical protein